MRGLIEWGGTLLVCVVVFVETGMFVGFFLPGDSLLVTAGVFAGAGQLKLAALLTLVTLCAIAGDQVGYFIGWRAGASLFRREDSRFLKGAISSALMSFTSAMAARQSFSPVSCLSSGHFAHQSPAPPKCPTPAT